jgi:uncharacterized BrkB/YihY/UPF0761 family membrane protein
MSDDKNLGLMLLALVFIAVNVPLELWTLSALWNWFAVPLGVQRMSWSLAFGLILILGVLRYRWAPSVKYSHAQYFEAALTKTFCLLMSLGAGWLVVTLGAR